MEHEGWAVVTFRPAEQPLRQLAEALVKAMDPAAITGPEPLRETDDWRDWLAEDRLHDAIGVLLGRGINGVLFVILESAEF
jgi:hypothetical protein